MAFPQPGIFAIGTTVHHHLQFDVRGEPAAVLEALREVRSGMGTVSGINMVVGFGPSFASRLWPDRVPAGLADFEPIVGPDGFDMPADQHDVWVWLHGAATSAMLMAARQVSAAVLGKATLVAECPAFGYGRSLDLTGFEDGTENPPLDEAIEIAAVPAGEAGAGGSVALLQRWVHDLDLFESLEVDERERVFGRTLVGSEELPDLDEHPGAHIERVVIEDDDGEELEVFRRSAPYGTAGEHGLMFLAFSADRDRLQRMLERMVGIGDGVRDRLTEFSTPMESAWYFVPPIELLRGGADAPGAHRGAAGVNGA